MYDSYDRSGPRVPAGETDYLAKAAALLDKVAEGNESPTVGSATRGVTRERLAHQYTLLGAIQRGVLPTEMARDLYESVKAGER
jgi:hypothetical protein